MIKKKSKILVIDASIARAAGQRDSVNPIAMATRDILNNILNICHKIAMDNNIRKEWDNHQSLFARKWLATMKAKKKMIVCKEIQSDKLASDISKRITGKKENIVQKDLHLIEAALATDKIIISLDNKTKDILSEISANIQALRSICWVNPISVNTVKVISWLENGAKSDGEWNL